MEVTTRLKIEPRKRMSGAKHQIPHMPSWHTYSEIYLFTFFYLQADRITSIDLQCCLLFGMNVVLDLPH